MQDPATPFLRESLRVCGALTAGGVVAAVELAFLLTVLANVDAHQPVFTDLSWAGVFWMSAAFCLFTLPIAWVFGLPLYWLLRRLNLVRLWICSGLGGIVGVLCAWGFQMFAGPVEWLPILWFVVSGLAAGSASGLLLRVRVNGQVALP